MNEVISSTSTVENQTKVDQQRIKDQNVNVQSSFEQQLSHGQQNRLEFLLQKVELFAHFINGSPTKSTNRGEKLKNKPKDVARKCPSEHDESVESEKKQKVPAIRFEKTPAYIHGEMRDYQLRGLNWLISLYENGINGILADEMGLGKTLQTISILGFFKFYEKIDGPFLVIAPKSTLQNWMNEFKKFCPEINTVGLIGNKDARNEIFEQMEKDNDGETDWDVCVTTYDMVLAEKTRLKSFRWRYIAVDEAHRLKNENNQISKILRKFHSTNRLLLTGTPLQNTLHELWALLNFLLPDIFKSSDDFDAWFDSDDCLRGNDEIVKRLHTILKPFMLRRVKADVEKSLLPKIEMKLFVGLTKLQRETYIKVLRKEVTQINQYGEPSLKRLDMIVQELRKAANHPYLIDGIEAGPPFITDDHLVNCCGKMMLLDKLLDKLKSQGSRVLIFSQFVIMLNILEDYLDWRGHEFRRLDGNTPYEQRANDIDEFNAENSNVFIYLISTKAGGLGINLATADAVIIYDSDWNPQTDLQAIDRVHRIGQKKQVRVFRLVTENTVDERIVQRAEIKLRLDNMVIQQGRNAEKLKGTKGMKHDVLRFGMDAILSSDEAGISAVDIDKILEYGEKKTAEDNEKLAEMGESQLRNMTLEEASSVSVYQFDGIDYRGKGVRKNDNLQLRERRSNCDGEPPREEEHKKSSQHRIVNLHVFKFYPLELFAFCDDDRYLTVDSDIKETLLAEGFQNWNRTDFKSFCDAVLIFGKNDIESIAKNLPNKRMEEVAKYHETFFRRGPTESTKIRRIIRHIELKEKKELEFESHAISLKWKLSQYKSPEFDLIFNARREHPHFSVENDRYLICALNKFGLNTPNVYGRIRDDIRQSFIFNINWFMRSRTAFEIEKRIHYLLSLVSKEFLNETDKENMNRKRKKNQTTASAIGASKKQKLD